MGFDDGMERGACVGRLWLSCTDSVVVLPLSSMAIPRLGCSSEVGGRISPTLFDRSTSSDISIEANIHLPAHMREITHAPKELLLIPFMLTSSDDATHRLCALILEDVFLGCARIPPRAQVQPVILPDLDFSVDVC